MASLNKHFRYYLSLNFNFSSGVFLFILFFHPFDASYSNVNNLILFFSGFGGILFILNNILFIAVPAILPRSIKISEWRNRLPLVLNALELVLNSVAFNENKLTQEEYIKEYIPGFMKKAFSPFIKTKDVDATESLIQGKAVYMSFVLKKIS